MVLSKHFPEEIRKISSGLKKLVSVPQSDAHLTGDQQVMDSILRQVRQHSFVEIAHDAHSLPSVDPRRAIVSFWWKNVHKY